MELSGEYLIPASREEVWQALNDPEILKTAIPGCESLEKTDETSFKAQVTSKIGPVKARFKGAVTLSNIIEPESYTITGEGQGGVAGFAKGSANVALTQAEGGTMLRYDAKGQVGGKLAQLGSRLVDQVARKTADDFFSAFAEQLGGKAFVADEVLAGKEEELDDSVGQMVHAAEEATEVAAMKGVMGGPQMWAWIALLAVIGLIVWLT